MHTDDKIIQRIQKLMALSESPNENEATNAAEKAQTLMLEHGIAAADLAHNDVDSVPVTVAKVRVTSGNWRAVLANAVAKSSGGKLIRFNNDPGTHNRKLLFYGPGDTAQAMVDTFRSMESALDSISKQECLLHKPSYEHGRTWRSSFLNSAVQRISVRLNERHKNVTQETNNPQALVLARTAVQKRFSTDFPRTVQSRATFSSSSVSGSMRGRMTGNSFNLGDRSVSAGRGALPA